MKKTTSTEVTATEEGASRLLVDRDETSKVKDRTFTESEEEEEGETRGV